MPIISDLIQLVYVSHPFGYDSATLSGILLDARRLNTRDGITGALVCRHDVFLQLLEGPADKIDATYERIRRDDRHVDPKQLVRRPITTRMFGDWAMLHDPAQSWIWTQQEIADGRLARAPEAEVVALFEQLALKVAQEQNRDPSAP